MPRGCLLVLTAAEYPVLEPSIQARIDEVRAMQESMSEEQYLDALEPLLVELALKNREIRDAEGSGG